MQALMTKLRQPIKWPQIASVDIGWWVVVPGLGFAIAYGLTKFFIYWS